jgi:hypothetical protein
MAIHYYHLGILVCSICVELYCVMGVFCNLCRRTYLLYWCLAFVIVDLVKVPTSFVLWIYHSEWCLCFSICTLFRPD